MFFLSQAMLYEDPHRWGFAFQANAQMTLARLHSQPAQSAIKVMERSIYSARYCFVENLYQKYFPPPAGMISSVDVLLVKFFKMLNMKFLKIGLKC